MKRRSFLLTAAAAAARPASGDSKPRIGLVSSSHARLARQLSPEQPLDYEAVRDMVRQAIQYGAPRAGSLEAKIRPGAWVVVKPNIVFLRPHPGYRAGDITDMRVTMAVVEYVARYTKAGRITIAEGGSYRRIGDKLEDSHVFQNDRPADATNFDWGPAEFPGSGGSVGGMLAGFAARFPDKRFDYADLAYDAVRNAAGQFLRVAVPKARNGVGAFGARPDYFVTKTITNCDFLISVPVMKCHYQCGITACLKNYVGTAPREAYQTPGDFNNMKMHDQHSVGGRIDHFIVDLASFHPPDYCVVDGIRGLQYQEHKNGKSDQTVRSNLVLAGEDPVATDALAARLLGFNPWDIEYLHLAAMREMGVNDLSRVDVVGDEPDRLTRPWGKPAQWHGRGNRDWLISSGVNPDLRSWTRITSPGDTLERAGGRWAAAVRILADGHRKGFLWVGVSGRAIVRLNGEIVMTEQNDTRYRIGQFKVPVELKSGENLLVFSLEALQTPARLSLIVTNSRDDGDTMEGIRYMA